MHSILTKLAEQEPLDRIEAACAMKLMLSGEVTPEEIAAFLLGLRARGETLEELIGLTEAMRAFSVKVTAPPEAVDIVGTGGDRSGSFNVSTTTAFVCAGAGAIVAKHGNRSVSSKCGSADVLAELGVKTELGKEGVEYCLDRAGMAFIFAPTFHPALKHVMPVRRSLKVRTCFNILGPLCNPASVTRQLVGAFSKEIASMMASILAALGSESAICVHAHDGMDEISISGPTTIFRVQPADDTIVEEVIAPEHFGLPRAGNEEIAGGDAAENAQILLSVLRGENGARRNIVALNASFALFAAGMADTVENGLSMAFESLDSSKALKSLNGLEDASQNAPGL